MINKIRAPKIQDEGDRFQREAREAIKGLDEPGARRLTLKSVSLPTGQVNLVSHQLGRKPVGWLVIDKTAQADVWRDASVATTNDKIPLRSSANVTVDIQVW